MPKYKKRNPDYSGFKNAHHILQYLSKTSPTSKDWTHFKKTAENHDQKDLFLARRTLLKIKKKHPKELAKDVLMELRKHSRDEDIGGGITEFFKWAGNATRIPGAIQSPDCRPV